MNTTVDTSKVAERRTLRFESIDDGLAELDRIAEADKQGNLRAVGNWTPGEVMSHLAAWIEYAYEGFPLKPPPFFIRWMLRLRLKKMLEQGMPTGVKIPGVKEGTYGMEKMDTQAAVERLKQAWQRLKNREEVKYHSPAFGILSHDDWIRLNLRHAELHLGFLVY